MILFFNVFLTNARHGHYQRYNLPQYDRFDVFMYTLATLAAINRFRVAHFYIALDQPFQHRRKEIEDFIHANFACQGIKIYSHRCFHYHEWREATDRLLQEPDDLIWWYGNDDHPFIDYDCEMIDRVCELMKNDQSHPDLACYLSHWPELTRTAGGRNPVIVDNSFLTFEWGVTDADQIINRNTLISWYVKHQWPPMIKSDAIQLHKYIPLKCYVPLREVCRHFDGHSHVGNLSNVCPPLAIPPGFFEKQMKVLYCSNERRPGWTHLNPCNTNYFAFHHGGTDYRWMLEDIPLAWQGRIVETEDQSGQYSPAQIIQARNEARMLMCKPPFHAGWSNPSTPYLPDVVFHKWMR